MGDIDLDRLAELAGKATPGPWVATAHMGIDGANVTDSVIYADRYEGGCGSHEDAQFIAAANPTVVLALIAELRAARELIRVVSIAENRAGLSLRSPIYDAFKAYDAQRATDTKE